MAQNTDTPALAALREADTRPALCTAFDVAISAAIWGHNEGRPSHLPDSMTAIHDFYDALSAHEDAVAARVRAELLASGTPLWVATDLVRQVGVRPGTLCRRRPQQDEDGDWYISDMRDWMRMDPPLTPPGTCRRAVLTILPEEAAECRRSSSS